MRDKRRLKSKAEVDKDEVEANAARDRADAWARSVAGTPYGVTVPVLPREVRRA
jgi:hypothetical protein